MNLKKFNARLKAPKTFYFMCAGIVFLIIHTVVIFTVGHIMANKVDEKVRKNEFKQGNMCFYDYKPQASKFGGVYDRAYYYYFFIDGKKGKTSFRPNFPFRQQWDNFIKQMDRKMCYRVVYLETKVLFYDVRWAYQVFEPTVPNPYFKNEN